MLLYLSGVAAAQHSVCLMHSVQGLHGCIGWCHAPLYEHIERASNSVSANKVSQRD